METQNTPTEAKKFALDLATACSVLRGYGKTPDDLRAMIAAFTACAEAKRIPIREFSDALLVHMTQADEIPTPNQLINICRPSGKKMGTVTL